MARKVQLDCENCKIQLSTKDSALFELFDIDDDRGEPIEFECEITRSEMESLIADTVERSIVIAKKALEGAKVRPDQLDKILLVGGSTFIPLVRQRLSEEFGVELDSSLNPMTVVAAGAALYASTSVIDVEEDIQQSEVSIQRMKDQGIDVSDLEEELSRVKAGYNDAYGKVDSDEAAVNGYVDRFYDVESRIISEERKHEQKKNNTKNDDTVKEAREQVETYGDEDAKAAWADLEESYQLAETTEEKTFIANKMNNLGFQAMTNNYGWLRAFFTAVLSKPDTKYTNAQKAEYWKSQHKEKVFEQAAKTMDVPKVLIVCDRGALDNKVYMNDLEFEQVLEFLGTNEIELRDKYDAVFHLVTAAKGAEEFYTTENNSARTETVAEAAALDDKLISAWTGHPHLRVIDNSSNFEDKMKRLIAEITSFLGEPEPYEIERKFLIEYPDMKWLGSIPNCRRVEIIQTYLKADDDEEIRVRQRGADGHYIYYQTTKRRISSIKRVEIERRLSESEYIRLLMNADTTMRQIRKDRYCLTYDNQYFEIDVYPFWNDKAILEIELSDENAEIRFPKEIAVIKEVTDDESYKNAALARIQ